MNWLTSPLAATAVVCLVLAMLAVPLRSLTTGRDEVQLRVPGGQLDAGDAARFSGVLRVRLLAPVVSLRVGTTEGELLWAAGELGAGEHEVDVGFSLFDNALELLVDADFGAIEEDTALFITVLPDGVEEQTQYVIGAGRIDEVLFYEWDLR